MHKVALRRKEQRCKTAHKTTPFEEAFPLELSCLSTSADPEIHRVI